MSNNQHLRCPCGESTDAFSIQSNGWGRCFGSCGGKNFSPEQVSKHMDNGAAGLEMAAPSRSGSSATSTKPKVKGNHTEITKVFKPFPERGFSQQAIERYKIDVGSDSASYEAKYPLFDINGNHVGNKVRRPEKKFLFEGEPNDLGLFGRHAFPAGSAKAITVTEGQDDAIAVYQMSGCRYPAVSVHSASTAERDMRNDFEYLNSFDTIVICFDNDEAGLKAAKACASLPFPVGKIRVMTPRKHKDPNEYLLAKEAEGFSREWWSAPTYKPDGLLLGNELWEKIMDRKESFTVPFPIKGLNDLTRGVRLSELIAITADPKIGKTSILKKIEYSLLTNPDLIEKGYGVGFMHFEEPVGDTALGLISLHNRTPYHLPETIKDPEDMKRAYDEVINNNRVVMWDHFGSNSVDAVLDKVRHMYSLGARYIIIDHLSIIVSDQSGDERKQLDEITTKLKTLTMELDICIIVVIHTNRQGQIRGTAGIEQLANLVLRLVRNKLDEDPWRRNVTEILVTENRFSGETGPAAYLYYNKDTTVMEELSDEEADKFKQGEAIEIWG